MNQMYQKPQTAFVRNIGALLSAPIFFTHPHDLAPDMGDVSQIVGPRGLDGAYSTKPIGLDFWMPD